MCHFFDLLTKCASTSLNCAFCMWWQRSYIIGMIYSLWRFLFCLKHKLESRGKWKCAFRVASLLLPAGGKKKSFLSGCSVCPPFISLELNGFGLFSKQEIPHAAKISVKLQPSRCQISLYLHPVWRIRFFSDIHIPFCLSSYTLALPSTFHMWLAVLRKSVPF